MDKSNKKEGAALPQDVESLFQYYKVDAFDYRSIQSREKVRGIVKKYSLLRELAKAKDKA